MAVPQSRLRRLYKTHHVGQPIHSSHSVFCSPHDLIAIVTATQDVAVYRLNGQVAFTIKHKDSEFADEGEEGVEVTAVCWRPDGREVAVAWKDGSWAVCDGEMGRVLGGGSVGEEDGSEGDAYGSDVEGKDGEIVMAFGWEQHVGGTDATTQNEMRMEIDMDMEGWAGEDELESHPDSLHDSGISMSLPDLPRSIATLDATQILPRLSALPSHGLRLGPEGSKYGSQAATDGTFDSSKELSSNALETFLLYTSKGRVHIKLGYGVPIGERTILPSAQPLKHASHPRSGSHTILARDDLGGLHLNILTLPMETLQGTLLQTVARETKRIPALVSYINQASRCMAHDYTTNLAFPTRLINNINAELAENKESQGSGAQEEGGDLPSHLTHLALTGAFTPPMLEWLSDIVKEPNAKRWDTALNTLYSHIQTHAFAHISPAIDRLSIALTTLRGFARFHDGASTFPVSEDLFTSALEIVDALRLLTTKVQVLAAREWSLWRAFSKWLRVQVEIASAGPWGKSAAETEEREGVAIDFARVLGYINGPMCGSDLKMYVEQKPLAFDGIAEKGGVLEMVRHSLGSGTKDHGNHTGVVSLPSLVTILSDRIAKAMSQVTVWQSRMLKSPVSIKIEFDEQVEVKDVLMLATHTKHDFVIRMLAVPAGEATALITQERRFTPSSNSGSTANMASEQHFDFGPDSVLDAKFIDETDCLVLHGPPDHNAEWYLSRITIQTQPYAKMMKQTTQVDALQAVVHSFSAADGFTPESLVVGGRKGKKVCTVFGNKNRSWQLLDLDSPPSVTAQDTVHE